MVCVRKLFVFARIFYGGGVVGRFGARRSALGGQSAIACGAESGGSAGARSLAAKGETFANNASIGE